MNKTTGIIVGIASVIILAGLIFYGMGNTAPIADNTTSNPVVVVNTTVDPAPVLTLNQGAPVAVTSSTAFPTDTTVIVSGTVVPNGAFSSYWFEFGKNESLGSKTPGQTVGSGYVSIGAPAYIQGLSKDTTYFYRLMALNQFGTVAGLQYSFKTTQGVNPPVGSAPTVKTIAASAVSRTTANLNGEVTPNKSGTVHWFEYGTSSSLGNTSSFVSVGDGTAKVSAAISFSDLIPATNYYFRLNAQNQFGTVNGAILDFKTSKVR